MKHLCALILLVKNSKKIWLQPEINFGISYHRLIAHTIPRPFLLNEYVVRRMKMN